ncbi:hypothetical protein BKA69DRAFT_1037648 [Paraphysoderma sedebokerense]|nr:hypothetical protein BKA69DRAFT_1037648 [Paraphysoderma sedebokerense]
MSSSNPFASNRPFSSNDNDIGTRPSLFSNSQQPLSQSHNDRENIFSRPSTLRDTASSTEAAEYRRNTKSSVHFQDSYTHSQTTRVIQDSAQVFLRRNVGGLENPSRFGFASRFSDAVSSVKELLTPSRYMTVRPVARPGVGSQRDYYQGRNRNRVMIEDDDGGGNDDRATRVGGLVGAGASRPSEGDKEKERQHEGMSTAKTIPLRRRKSWGDTLVESVGRGVEKIKPYSPFKNPRVMDVLKGRKGLDMVC